ncbi:MAG: LysR family transcriptional regulator [Rhodobacteraceae bacterium]|jgi:LysR family glycine cleavage system transcriptional activator|nr:LysR family transcriptional regulator [Paracoccaceae bacterium]
MALTLPPLNALRAFEAAARLGSHVAASAELGISAAAVSQHIRNLEDHLGKQLFLRLNNRILLTDAGQALHEGVAAGLQLISDTTEAQMQRRTRARLVISCIESVAEAWLAPRLAEFAAREPEFRFDLRVEPDPVAFARYDIDLRLAYDPARYPDHAAVELVRDHVLPVASPAIRDRLAVSGLRGVAGEDLLHTGWGPDFGTQPTWAKWFAAAGLPLPPGAGYQIDRSALTLDLAARGLGVALVQRLVAGDALAEGRLAVLSDLTLPLSQPYALVWPRTKTRKRHLAQLVAFLVERAASERKT